MHEQSREQTYNDSIPRESKVLEEGFEVLHNKATDSVTYEISEISDNLTHDRPVTGVQILNLKQNMGRMVIEVEGEKIRLDDLPELPGIRKNVEIFKEIKSGNFEKVEELTFLPLEIAKILVKNEKQGDYIHLKSLTKISDEVLETLSFFSGRLRLEIADLSEKAAENFGLGKLKILEMPRVTALSDTAIEKLSRSQASFDFSGLTSLSLKSAGFLIARQRGANLDGLKNVDNSLLKLLTQLKGGLSLSGLTEISSDQARILSNFEGTWLILEGIKELSDEAAELLAQYKGKHLSLNNLTDISDAGLKYLAGNNEFNFMFARDLIKNRIAKLNSQQASEKPDSEDKPIKPRPLGRLKNIFKRK